MVDVAYGTGSVESSRDCRGSHTHFLFGLWTSQHHAVPVSDAAFYLKVLTMPSTKFSSSDLLVVHYLASPSGLTLTFLIPWDFYCHCFSYWWDLFLFISGYIVKSCSHLFLIPCICLYFQSPTLACAMCPTKEFSKKTLACFLSIFSPLKDLLFPSHHQR